MVFMKRTIIILTLIVLSVSAFALVCEPEHRISAKDFYIMPMTNEVSARDGEWTCDEDYEDYFQTIYDCGFNTAGFMPVKYLHLAKKYNIMTNIQCTNLIDKSITDNNKRAEDWAKKIAAAVPEDLTDYILRIYVKDEPKLSDVPELKAYSQAIKKYTKFQPYINLNPNYADLNYLQAKSYYEYADTITKECGLDYVCYDNYSIDTDEGLQEKRFYSNLEEISKVADDNNVGFINIISSTAHFNYAMPSDWSINVQVWSTLAYGGKGIAYFKWIDPQRTNYRGSAIDHFGNKTPTYNIIKNVNYALHNIGWCYTKLQHKNTFHIGKVPEGCKTYEDRQFIDQMESSSRDDNLVVGEFTDKEGTPYAVIVNKSQTQSNHIRSISFKGCKGVNLIEEYSNKNRRERDFCSWSELMWIAPGHGVLLKGVK